VETLVKSPADPRSDSREDNRDFRILGDRTQPDAAANAVRLFRNARQRDPQAFLFPRSS